MIGPLQKPSERDPAGGTLPAGFFIFTAVPLTRLRSLARKPNRVSDGDRSPAVSVRREGVGSPERCGQLALRRLKTCGHFQAPQVENPCHFQAPQVKNLRPRHVPVAYARRLPERSRRLRITATPAAASQPSDAGSGTAATPGAAAPAPT
jgi:hypothetical protein